MKQQITGSLEGGPLALKFKDSSGNLVDLDQREINVDAYHEADDDLNRWRVHFYYVMKNEGDVAVGYLTTKFYANFAMFPNDSPSADETRYKYETS